MNFRLRQEKQTTDHWRILVCRLCVLLFLHSCARLLLFSCNHKFFGGENLLDIVWSFAVGLRFDIATLAAANLPVWIFWSLPCRIRSWKWPNIPAELWFVAVNFLALFVNVVDARYFSFTIRRLSGDILRSSVMLSENPSIYLDMLTRYWYLAAVGVIFAVVLLAISHRLSLVGKTQKIGGRDYFYFLVSSVALIVCIRGGFQSQPLKPAEIHLYAPTARMATLVNNSAFNVYHTRKSRNLPSPELFNVPDGGAFDVLLPDANDVATLPRPNFKGRNVFVLILESFSAEYVGALDGKYKDNGRDLTPFFDSLIARGYVFDGFANGMTSADGLTSVLLGIPALFDSFYTASAYGGNRVDPLASALRRDGYETIFFYGGKKNSCHFDSIRKTAEVEKYYCKSDYDGPGSDNGGCGIFDEEFLQFAARKIDGVQKPFFAVLFTLSSHHPYVYPRRLHGKFPRGEEPLQELIGYTDYALEKFFKTAEKMDWYKNTVFIIVADHTAGHVQRYYRNAVGRYSIPIVVFDPNGQLVGKSDVVAQQIDLPQTILNLLGSEQKCFSFGHDLFDASAPKFAVEYVNGCYQLISRDYVCQFDGKKTIGLYGREDFLLENNLADDPEHAEERSKLENALKAFLRHYCTALDGNTMGDGD
jgi:phosphoglycerol transferase MdoB-like AlkP superfamily enzyme